MEMGKKILWAVIFAMLLGMRIPPDMQIKDTTVSKVSLPVKNQDIGGILKIIEEAIGTGSVNKMEKYFGMVVSVTIGQEIQGYYSKGQAISVLTGYFSNCKPISFEFSEIDKNASSPYAAGRLLYQKEANRGIAQIYVALTLQDSTWVITQLNIY
jgi:hypothetical protein